MADKPELNKPSNETPEAVVSPLVAESMELHGRHVKPGDNLSASTPVEGLESLLSNTAFEAALEELTQQFRAMAETAKRLPPQVRDLFLESIGNMTGDSYPAYDLFRIALASDK